MVHSSNPPTQLQANSKKRQCSQIRLPGDDNCFDMEPTDVANFWRRHDGVTSSQIILFRGYQLSAKQFHDLVHMGVGKIHNWVTMDMYDFLRRKGYEV